MLGVASGIGVDVHTASAPVTPQLIIPATTPATAPARIAQHYFGSAEPPADPVIAMPVAEAPTTSVAAVPAPTPSASSTAATARLPQSTGTASTTCAPGLLSGLLDALVASAGSPGGGLLDLGGLLGGFSGPASGDGLLSTVTSLLPGVLSAQHAAATAPTPALEQACTSSVSSMLPLLGGLL